MYFVLKIRFSIQNIRLYLAVHATAYSLIPIARTYQQHFITLGLKFCLMIVSATPEDASRLNQLVNSAYRGDSSRQGWTTEADLLDGTRTDADALAALLQTPGTRLLKYVEHDEIIGCVELRNQDGKLYLGMLTVKPNLQGKGIGKELLKAAEQEALNQRCHTIYMTVISERKELIAWYVRHGYHLTGETKPFAFNDPRFGQPKRKLEFVVLEKKIAKL